MWGVIPAAGMGTRIQPLAFSKELLPIGTDVRGSDQRPRAISEYLIERMVMAGVDKVCFVISPGKSDIVNYFGGEVMGAKVFYAVQPRPAGLCDAIFRALPLIPGQEQVCIGLPDTIWYPEDGLALLPDDLLALLLFPVSHPEHFDAVVTNERDEVSEVQVKKPGATSNWVWGAMKMPGDVLHALYALWVKRGDEYLGTLFNEYIAQGGRVGGYRAGEAYVDTGTLNGYRDALRLLDANCLASAQSA
jgi:glucose-1-phosphate thymidylyltransferase